MKAHWHCDECGYDFANKTDTDPVYDADLKIPAGHTFGELIPEVPATCAETGMDAHYECAVCHGLFDTDRDPAAEAQLIIAATGKHTWDKETGTCAVCKGKCPDTDKHACDEACPTCGYQAEHVWADEYAMVLHPECESDGMEARPCMNCDCYDEGRAVPALGHLWHPATGHCVTCGNACDNWENHSGAAACPICGYRAETKPQESVNVTKAPAVTENGQISSAAIGLYPGVLQTRRDIFTAAELHRLTIGKKATLWLDIGNAPELTEEELAAILSLFDRDPVGTLTLDIRLMKQFGKEPPIEVTKCDQLPVKITPVPESIPEGTTGVFVVTDGAEAPVECGFNAETGEITFRTDVFGVVTFVFF